MERQFGTSTFKGYVVRRLALSVITVVVSCFLQQPVHRPLAHRMTLRLQFRRQPRLAAAGPRNGPIGSPRVTGSTNRSKACSKLGSCAVNRLRPAPSRRTRPGSSSAPDASCAVSSCTPARIVVRDIPVAAVEQRIKGNDVTDDCRAATDAAQPPVVSRSGRRRDHLRGGLTEWRDQHLAPLAGRHGIFGAFERSGR